jgi:hypothetical protein
MTPWFKREKYGVVTVCCSGVGLPICEDTERGIKEAERKLL